MVKITPKVSAYLFQSTSLCEVEQSEDREIKTTRRRKTAAGCATPASYPRTCVSPTRINIPPIEIDLGCGLWEIVIRLQKERERDLKY